MPIVLVLLLVLVTVLMQPLVDWYTGRQTEKWFYDQWKKPSTPKKKEELPKPPPAPEISHPLPSGSYYLILPDSDNQRETYRPVTVARKFLEEEKRMAEVSIESGQVFVLEENRLIEAPEGTVDRLVKLRKDEQYYSLGFLKVPLLAALATMGYVMSWVDLRKKATHLLEGGPVETDADEAIMRVIHRVQAIDMPYGYSVEYRVCTPDGVLEHKSCQLYQERLSAWLQNPRPPFPAYTVELAHAHREQDIKEHPENAERVWIRRTVTERANQSNVVI